MTRRRTLLVDLGNTRIKWAWLHDNGRPGRMHAALHGAAGEVTAVRSRINEFPPLLPRLRSADRVLVVSVAAPAVHRRFVAAVRAAVGAAPRRVRSGNRAAALRNGYRDPHRLGADRWAALAGARLLQGDVLVVDAGTAVTIDLLLADGRHRGGCILPGLRLMSSSLLQGTGGIRRRAGEPAGARRQGGLNAATLTAGPRRRTTSFARSTREAVAAGGLLALVGAVERAVEEAAVFLGRPPLVLLTGGDAPAIAARLQHRHEIRPALVLEGLAELSRPPAPSASP